jgi:hypothetical protein
LSTNEIAIICGIISAMFTVTGFLFRQSTPVEPPNPPPVEPPNQPPVKTPNRRGQPGNIGKAVALGLVVGLTVFALATVIGTGRGSAPSIGASRGSAPSSGNPTPADSNNVSASTAPTESSSPSPVPLKFDYLYNGESVGQNVQVTLTGTVPSGEYLWIFVHDSTGYYVQGAPTSLSDNYWHLTDGVTLGSNTADAIDAPYTIYAVLADPQANSAIKEDYNRTGGNTGTSAIPGDGGAQEVASVTVIRTH